MYHWDVCDDVSCLVANFLRSFKYFWGDHKGSKICWSNVKQKKLTNRKVHTPAQKRKDKIHQDFFRLLDSGLLFLNTDKKPWGDHEIMARIHPSWRSHLCSLLGCSFNGLGAPWPLRMGRMGWMSCCVGCIQHYPNMEKCREEVGWFWIWWWEDVEFGWWLKQIHHVGQSSDFSVDRAP